MANARQLGMAGRILFPIPERGLSQRLYRIKAKTVIVWGDSDRLIPPTYAHAFKKGIAGAQLVSIPEAGHMVIVEKTAAGGRRRSAEQLGLEAARSARGFGVFSRRLLTWSAGAGPPRSGGSPLK